MHVIDWLIVTFYCLLTLGVGFWFTKRASTGGLESYFASNRQLPWWLAGTSMAATALSTDTPLLVTGLVRTKGIWGNWQIWCLAVSTMFAVFFFSKFWKRAGVLTEVALVELRYSGKPAAFLRGFKAFYWGVFYNCFIMGAWPVTGLVKIMQETTGWDKTTSIFFSFGLTAIYCSVSGYWGVIYTDLFQFFWIMAGAIVLSCFAVHAAGGLPHILSELQGTDKLLFFPPPTPSHDIWSFFATPLGWVLGLLTIQWWAWKNTDVGGVIVQRLISSKNEKQALYSMLWFNIAQYALRMIPWILTALASLILLPDSALMHGGVVDHERAYPRLVTELLPIGLKGFLIASFFAAFMSTIDSQLNWGASYFVNDFYKRFIRKEAPDKHYLLVSKIAPFFLAAGACFVAFHVTSIAGAFQLILSFTAGIGPVYFWRWFWWRINPWSEISALITSIPVILLRPVLYQAFHIEPSLPVDLFTMIFGTALVWVPVTFLTRPVPHETLRDFFQKVQPPGFWNGWKRDRQQTGLLDDLLSWVIGTAALFLTTFGSLDFFLGQRLQGLIYLLLSGLGWWYVARKFSFNTIEPSPINPKG